MARHRLVENLFAKTVAAFRARNRSVVQRVDVIASQLSTFNFDAEADRIFAEIAREMETVRSRVFHFHGHCFQTRSRLRIRQLSAAGELIRQVMVNLELKLGRMRLLRKELLGRFRKLLRLMRDLAVGVGSCFLTKRHRRLINQTDFAHDYSLIRLRCTVPAFTSPASTDKAGGPVNSLRCCNENAL